MPTLRTQVVAASALALPIFLLFAQPASAARRMLIQGNNKLAIVAADGSIEWEMPWGAIHDVHVLPNGNFLLPQGASKIVELDPKAKKIVWTYDAATSNGNAGKKVEVHAFQPLDEGHVMIAESGPGRIIEIDRDGKIRHELKLKIDKPSAHHDTRLARKLPSGNYLVCHEADGVVREYAQDGAVVWQYAVPLFDKPPRGGHGPESWGNACFAAVRLASGNTLIATGNGHSVLEVTPQKEIVWKLEQNELPGISLAWVTTLEVLPGGNYVIGNCHAGPKNPLVIEVDPRTKKVVWTLDKHDAFGNSASNSQVLGVDGAVR